MKWTDGAQGGRRLKTCSSCVFCWLTVHIWCSARCETRRYPRATKRCPASLLATCPTPVEDKFTLLSQYSCPTMGRCSGSDTVQLNVNSRTTTGHS